MAVTDYNGKEKVSLSNAKELWQYIIGGGAQVIRKAMGLGDTLGPLQPECGGTGKADSSGVGSIAYPVGSIYLSVNSTNPSTLFGGTWRRIQGRFLFAADSKHAAGSTGGEETHRLTVDEMPSHTHKQSIGSTAMTANAPLVEGFNSFGEETGAAGGDQPHNNMPPYLSVYMWKRTA